MAPKAQDVYATWIGGEINRTAATAATPISVTAAMREREGCSTSRYVTTPAMPRTPAATVGPNASTDTLRAPSAAQPSATAAGITQARARGCSIDGRTFIRP